MTLSDLLTDLFVAEQAPTTTPQHLDRALMALLTYLTGAEEAGDYGEISDVMLKTVAFAQEAKARGVQGTASTKLDSFRGLSLLLVATQRVPALPGRTELGRYLEETIRVVWGKHAPIHMATWRVMTGFDPPRERV